MKGMLAAACVMAAAVLAPVGAAGTAQAQGVTNVATMSPAAEPGTLLTLVRRGGGMGGVHIGGGRVVGGGHIVGGGRFVGGHAFRRHRFHGGGLIFAAPFYYPYYAYNDDDCWWSRRYGRWVCPY